MTKDWERPTGVTTMGSWGRVVRLTWNNTDHNVFQIKFILFDEWW